MINHPVLGNATYSPGGSSLSISGSFLGLTGQVVTIEVFVTPKTKNPQGRTFVGAFTFQASALMSSSFSAVLPGVTIPKGWVVTATATDGMGSTSEFSNAVEP
jgi:hypothetical protein